MSADERVGSALRAEVASRLALLGGRIALDRFHRARVEWDADGSIVTDADLDIQHTLAAEIAATFPDDGVVGEEAEAGVRPAARYAWVLDPIDGTNNFARGIPGFSISVGVLRDGMPFAGAVYDPVARWLFNGCAGRGAWLNDRPLRTRAEPLSARSLVSLRMPWSGAPPPFAEDWLRRYRLRRFGSTALHLCYAAIGALDVVHDDRASLREVAGAAPVLLEAGGRLSTDDGAPLFPASRAAGRGGTMRVLAGNPASHPQALADIERARVPAFAR